MASWTFDACAAESGAEGLKVLMAAAAYGVPVDCVVLDYQMPGMTGAEMARDRARHAGDRRHADRHADLGRPVAVQYRATAISASTRS